VECLLVNTTGELMDFYRPASLVFVGKSLTAKGGQNPIEPAALGKPVVFGPNMQNFTDIVRIFLAQNGAVQVHDAAALEKTLGDLLDDPGRRAELGCNARKIVEENQGGVNRTVDLIVKELEARKFYVAPKKTGI
jgi:3-deoxy-D-manno-octulosonic-acid transferase